MKPDRSKQYAERKLLLGAKKNRKAGVRDRAEVPRSFLGQLKAALKRWDLEQRYPHLRRTV